MSLRFVNVISVASIVAFLVVQLGFREAQRQDWQHAVADVNGEGMYTFTLADAPIPGTLDWSAADISELRSLPGVTSVSWRGGQHRTQVPGSGTVIPYSFVTSGYPEDLNLRILSGKKFTIEDEGRSRALVGSALAARLFPSVPLDDVVGRYLNLGDTSVLILGVYEGDDALVALSQPVEQYGSVDVSTVLLRSSLQENDAMGVLSGWLAGKENLTALQATSYRDLVRPDVQVRNSPYQREIASLFEWLAICALALATINITNQALLLGAQRQSELALARACGATRRRLLWLEIRPYLQAEGAAVAVGLVIGTVLARALGGSVTLAVLLTVTAAVIIALAIGSLPATSQVFRIFPWRVLREGPRATQRTWLRVLGAVGLVGSIALVVAAGGFATSGRKVLEVQIAGIGADLYRFQADQDSLLPAQALTPADLDAMQQEFPTSAFLLLVWDLVTVNGHEVQAQVVKGDYFGVSGTRLDREPGVGGSGIYLGAALAREMYGGEDAPPTGAKVDLEYRARSVPSVMLLGTAREPTVGNLESLQLPAQAAVVAGEVLPPRTVLGWRLYARLSDPEAAAVQHALNKRVAEGAAPFVATKVAKGYDATLARLEAQGRRFAVAAVIVLLLAAAGVTTMLYSDVYVRRRETALGRVFGNTQAGTLTHLILRSCAMVLALAVVGSAIGTAAYLWLAGQRDYTLIVPAAWILGSAAGALGLGLAVAGTAAHWLSSQPPLRVLRGHA